jgi:hypothetical protein
MILEVKNQRILILRLAPNLREFTVLVNRRAGILQACLTVGVVVGIIIPTVNAARVEAGIADRHYCWPINRLDESTADGTR